MKKLNYFLSFLFILLMSSFYAQSNRVNYDRDSKWNFGLNAGATWQEKELDFVNSPALSGGFTLGRAIYEKEGRLLSFDLRGRLLAGQTKGWSSSLSRDSSVFSSHAGGYGYKNYKFEYVEGSLELVVNAHRLRERTGILLYAFGGVGFVSHSVRHNYKDGILPYDYTVIDSTASNSSIANTLKYDFEDYSWEKGNDFFDGTQTLFMPSLGLGLGYQITPKISVGIEHKVTFGLNDYLDGHKDGKNDRYHYTNFNVRWNLFRGEEGNGSTYVPEERPVGNPNVPIGNNNPSNNGNVEDYSTPPTTEVPQGNKPLVNITSPSNNGATINSPNYTVNAKIYYVNQSGDIVFMHNGNRITNFSFNSNTNLFSANVVLTQGSNSFVITGSNSEGSDTDTKNISFVEICNKPIISFIFPASNNTSVSTPSTRIEAKLLYVSDRNNIRFRQNGVLSNQFSFNTATNLFVANVNCVSGNNVFQIEASNACGLKNDDRSISYKKILIPGKPPVVTFTNPTITPFTVNSSQTTISATLLNVNNASDIEYKLNGVVNNVFNFNTVTKSFVASVNLQNGNNIIELKGVNGYGVDSKSIILVRKQEEVNHPIVAINYPAVSPFSVTSNTSVVNGTVHNVSSRNQIQVMVNGVATNSFIYDFNTKQINLTATLNSGSNTILIRGSNNYGVDSKSTIITYKKAVVELPPAVNFIYPSTSPMTTIGTSVSVKARVLNVTNTNQIQVMQNGVITQSFNYNLMTKELLLNAALVQGNNSFVITATNQSGSDSKTTIITYKKRVAMLPPSVSILSPSTSPKTTIMSNASIRARVLNVTNASQIQVKQNGVVTQLFNYNLGTRELLLNAALVQGNNSFVITATNQSGSDSKTTIVVYKSQVAQLPPVVTMLFPQGALFNTVNSSELISAKIDNVSNQSQISLNFNGAITPSFSFNTATKTVSFNAALLVGANALTITATNNSGVDTKSISIIRTEACPSPVLNYRIPAQSPHNHVGRNGNMAFTITSSNITSISQIIVKNNGFKIPANLEISNGNIWGTVALAEGTNNFVVTAKNDCGNSTLTLELLYQGAPVNLVPPVITIQTPSVFPYSTTNGSITVLGKVVNVASQNDIQVTIDGNRTPFTYSALTKVLTIPVSLSVGIHQVNVVATNNDGNDVETFDIVRKVQPPVVQYTNLGNGNSYRNPFICPQPSYTVQGKVTNFQNVTFNAYVNGSRISNFSYNSRTGDFSIPVTFSVQGQGTQRRLEVEVKVSNSIGVGSRKGHLTYTVQNIVTKPNSGASTGTGSVSSSYKQKQAYQVNINKADDYFKQGKYSLAKNYYQKALVIFPKENYPKQKVEEINKKLKAASIPSKVVVPTVSDKKEDVKPLNKPVERVNKFNNRMEVPITKP